MELQNWCSGFRVLFLGFQHVQSFTNAEPHNSLSNYGLLGRETEYDELFNKTQEKQLISVWGMPGVGKSALVKAIYDGKLRTSDQFKRHAWVSVSHPFNPTDFCRSLLVSLHRESTSTVGNYAEALLVEDPIKECRDRLRECGCLFVIDGVQSNEDWDWIKSNLIQYGDPRSCSIIITSEESIAKHCAVSIDGVYNVKGLHATAAIELFEKVLRESGSYRIRGMERSWKTSEEVAAELILSKCVGGLPRVITSVAGYLATKPGDVLQQEKTRLSDNFMQELMSNPEFESLRGLLAWLHSNLHACPRHLKKCMLYLSIFPQDIIIRRRRLIRRWVAEGYSKGTDSISTEKYAEKIFDEVAALIIMQPVLQEATNKVIGYQVNGFFREYILSRPVEEEAPFFPVEVSALEKLQGHGHGRLATYGSIGQHLAIGRSTWEKDSVFFQSLDFSRLRSLTLFDPTFWSWYVSDRMRVLRVLDLENAKDVIDDDFEKIGKLPSRLKFLSLRGQSRVTHLPDSVGDLVQLQTLDIRGTNIRELPPFITRLQKLEYIRAGTSIAWTTDADAEEPTPPSSSRSRRTLASCLPNKLFRRAGSGGPVDVSSQSHSSWGVVVPRGINKRLKALQTLGAISVNTANGEATLDEIVFSLPQLKKLQVSGISGKQGRRSLYDLDRKTHLESLSLQFEENNPFVHWQDIWIPRSLRSLKMYGHVEQLPRDINHRHDNLVKLTLEMTKLFTTEVIKVLGSIPNLQTLRLRVNKDQDGELQFPATDEHFRKLQIVEIACKSKLHLRFDEGAMQKLEHLKLHCLEGSEMQVSGLEHLFSLKQVWLLLRPVNFALRQSVQQQLDSHHHKVPAPKLVVQTRVIEPPKNRARSYGILCTRH